MPTSDADRQSDRRHADSDLYSAVDESHAHIDWPALDRENATQENNSRPRTRLFTAQPHGHQQLQHKQQVAERNGGISSLPRDHRQTTGPGSNDQQNIDADTGSTSTAVHHTDNSGGRGRDTMLRGKLHNKVKE